MNALQTHLQRRMKLNIKNIKISKTIKYQNTSTLDFLFRLINMLVVIRAVIKILLPQKNVNILKG